MRCPLRCLGLLTLLTLLSSCGGSANHDSTNGSSFSTINNPPVNVPTNNGMYVHLYQTGQYPSFMNKAGAFGTDCMIADGSTLQDIVCYLDMLELDLYDQAYSPSTNSSSQSPVGIQLQYNVPSDMCSYFDLVPYWYFNAEIGYGPQNIAITINENADSQVTSVSCTVDGTASCTGGELNVNTTTGGFTCVYDQSQNTYPGPNCCFGTYNAAVTTVTPTTSSTVFSTNVAWNSNEAGAQSCLGGPVMNSWPAFTKRGLPESLLTFVAGTGLNSLFAFRPPIVVPNGGSVVSVANYYGDVSHTHTGYVVARSSNYPYAVDPVDDRNGTNLETFDSTMPLVGNDAYEFRCLDEGKEVINRIRLYIRSWNTYTDFIAYGTSNGTTYNPDVTGDEGTACRGLVGPCNDLTKWDSTSLTGPYTSANRVNYFPNETY